MMTRIASALALAIAVAGCEPRDTDFDLTPPPPITQEEYTFPGCEPEDGPVCPRSKTAECAIDLIRERYTWCFEDFDCEIVRLPRRCFPRCEPIAINYDQADEFLEMAGREADRYCDAGDCVEPATCPPIQAVAVCEKGWCTWVEDTGEDAEGMPDAE